MPNAKKIKLKPEGPDLSRYCGTTADDQYQAEDFLATIHKETCREEISQDLLFCQTSIWDASLLLNMAFTNIQEGKCGNSQTFFNKFIKRANEFNHLLGPTQTDGDYTTRRDFFVFKSKLNRQGKEIVRYAHQMVWIANTFTNVWEKWKNITTKRQ